MKKMSKAYVQWAMNNEQIAVRSLPQTTTRVTQLPKNFPEAGLPISLGSPLGISTLLSSFTKARAHYTPIISIISLLFVLTSITFIIDYCPKSLQS